MNKSKETPYWQWPLAASRHPGPPKSRLTASLCGTLTDNSSPTFIMQLEAFVKELNMTALQGWIVIGLLVLIVLGIVGLGAEIQALPYLWRTSASEIK